VDSSTFLFVLFTGSGLLFAAVLALSNLRDESPRRRPPRRR